MNVSIDYTQNNSAIQPDTCSEDKCINCFENRGCMYDWFAAMQDTKDSSLLQTQQANNNLVN